MSHTQLEKGGRQEAQANYGGQSFSFSKLGGLGESKQEMNTPECYLSTSLSLGYHRNPETVRTTPERCSFRSCRNNFPAEMKPMLPLLVGSLLFGVLQLVDSAPSFRDDLPLSWTRRAAQEAEAAALYACSGHGYVFVDTYLRDAQGRPLCECNDCYTGHDCSQFIANCSADVESGDPVFMEPFWIKNAEASAVVVPGWYRMSYKINDAATSIVSQELEKQIRALHDLVGNAVTKGRYIVVGAGSTQLLNAAVNSLSPVNSSATNLARVVAATPYYGAYQSQTEKFRSADYAWYGDARNWTRDAGNRNSSTIFVEFVASPNNPDGIPQKAVLEGENVRAIYDHAYYWPHFTPIQGASDEDVMLFTLSKVSGHAGTRLGWAIIKDYALYQKFVDYIDANTIGVSHDAQLRATQLIKTMLAGYSNYRRDNQTGHAAPLRDDHRSFHYAYRVMRNRWQRVQKVFAGSERFSLQDLKPGFCSFFNRTTGPSPAYAWVKCKKEEDKDCLALLKSGGIVGRAGRRFGADSSHVRLSLIKRDENFALLERRLQAFLASNSSTHSP